MEFETGTCFLFDSDGEPEGQEFYVRAWPEDDFYINVGKRGVFDGEPQIFVSRPSDMDVPNFAEYIQGKSDELNTEACVRLYNSPESVSETVFSVNLDDLDHRIGLEEGYVPVELVQSVLVQEEGYNWIRDVYGSPSISRTLDSEESLTQFLVEERGDYEEAEISGVSEMVEEVKRHEFDWRNPNLL